MAVGSTKNYWVGILVFVALVATLLAGTPGQANGLQAGDVVINEVVAANDSFLDNFGDTPDWVELQNNTSSSVDLTGWTIADGGGPWVIPGISLGAGQRIVLFASGRDLTAPQLHTDFALTRTGESITLANADGLLVDSLVYPSLGDDVAYGRGALGGTGVLLAPTPVAPNTDLAPSSCRSSLART